MQISLFTVVPGDSRALDDLNRCLRGHQVLAPNQRPLQVTDDLSNFWREVYPKLKPALSRRYPRHEWRYLSQDFEEETHQSKPIIRAPGSIHS